MAPVKPSSAAGAPAPTLASVPSVPSTPSAKADKGKKPGKPGKKTDVEVVLGKAQQALRHLRMVSKYATAWSASLGEVDRAIDMQKNLAKVVQATEAKALNRLVEMEQTLQALVEARWTPPKVSVAAGGKPEIAKDDHVTFRDGYGARVIERGIATKEEIAEMVVVRVSPGKKDDTWVTAISSKTQNHFGPLPSYNFKLL
jgi:hypothetical protein